MKKAWTVWMIWNFVRSKLGLLTSRRIPWQILQELHDLVFEVVGELLSGDLKERELIAGNEPGRTRWMLSVVLWFVRFPPTRGVTSFGFAVVKSKSKPSSRTIRGVNFAAGMKDANCL